MGTGMLSAISCPNTVRNYKSKNNPMVEISGRKKIKIQQEYNSDHNTKEIHSHAGAKPCRSKRTAERKKKQCRGRIAEEHIKKYKAGAN